MQTLGIIGGGVLGRAICRGFMEHAEVRVFDVVRERSTHNYLADVAMCDIVMIALPTPANPDGTCNTLHIEDFLNTAKHEGWWTPESCYCIRSTVPIGFTQAQAAKQEFRLPLLHSPEFLTARCSIVDFQCPARNIIGVPRFKHAHCPGCGRQQLPARYCDQCGVQMKFTEDDLTAERVRHVGFGKLLTLYKSRFPGIEVHAMQSNASELVKLACNTFFASKVTLFNLFAEIAKAADVPWDDVRGGVLSDGRIAHAHTLVAEQPIGYGGTCLVAGTVVRTQDGETPIEDVEVGDIVEDRGGSSTVTAKASRIVEKVVTIRARGRTITGSADHRHMVFDGHRLVEARLDSIRPCEMVFIPQPADTERRPIEVGPRPSNKCKVWHEQFEWSPDLAWLVGIWLAEGFKSLNTKKNTARIHWCHGEAEEYLADEVCRIVSDLGLHPQKYLKVGEGTFGTSRCWSVRTDSLWLFRVLESIGTGDYCHGKRAPDLDAEIAQHLIGGWLDGDGSRHQGTVSGHSQSQGMIRDFDRLFRRVGICPQVNRAGTELRVSMRGDVDRICSWCKRLRPEEGRFARSFAYESTRMRRHENGWLVEVQEVAAENRQTEVFAIETTSGTYVANGLLTHNCLPKDLADLYHSATALGVDAEILRAVHDRNERLRRPHDTELAKIALPPR